MVNRVKEKIDLLTFMVYLFSTIISYLWMEYGVLYGLYYLSSVILCVKWKDSLENDWE